tara:strand:+ start:220 stop:1851 length:1632 start_codon:yes stop_codon:yes gene_type:complete
LTFFWGLGFPAITDSDEGFYAEGAREMIESEDWVTPRFNYTNRFEKPILYYWLAATSYKVFGTSEFSARLPSALSGLALSFLSLIIGSQLFNKRVGLLAGTITATSFGIILMGRQALPDLPLAFFVSLTTWSAFCAGRPHDQELLPEGNHSPTRLHWSILCGLSAGAGFLMKGPVALILPTLILSPFLIRRLFLKRTPSRLRQDLQLFCIGVAIFLIVSTPWFYLMVNEHGMGYLERFFLTENLDRFLTDQYNSPRPWWYYIPIVFGGLLPWSLFSLCWLKDLFEKIRPDKENLFLIWWATAPFVFFSLSGGQQPRYVLPLIIPLALLLAKTAHQQLDTPGQNKSTLFSLSTILAGGIFILLGMIISNATPLFFQWSPAFMLSSSILIATSGIGICLTTFRPAWTVLSIATAVSVTTIVIHTFILDTPNVSPVEKMAALIEQHGGSSSRYGRHAVLNRNLIFYTKKEFIELPILKAASDLLTEPEPILCVLRETDVELLEDQGILLSRLAEVSSLNIGGINLRSLLNPSADAIQKIILVTNAS